MKDAPPRPNAEPRREGLQPAGVTFDALVKSLRAPLDLKAPRKLEKV